MNKSSGLVIIVNNKILLVKPKGLKEGYYSIPKGLVEKNESILEAAIRETYEETGLLFYKNQINNKPHICNYISNSGKITKRVYYFVVKLKKEELNKIGEIDTKEVDYYKFYERHEAEKIIYWKMMSVLNHINSSFFSTKELLLYEKLNIVKKVKHPIYPIFLYNYTEKCKQLQFWNDTTLWCRGLVLDVNGNVIARPFKKFFEEHQLYDEYKSNKRNVKIYEKIDGALGILFFYKERPIMCNRQSFKSRQAVVGLEILYKKYVKQLNFLTKKNRTYLFEIIYPSNRFVVNYGNDENLYLLGVVETNTGDIVEEKNNFIKPNQITIDTIYNKKGEGAVLHFEDDFKIKIKTDNFKKRYEEIENIKKDIAYNTRFLFKKGIKENWNLDYYKVQNLFLKKYLLIYLNYYEEKDKNYLEIIKLISKRKIFPG